MKKLFYTKIKFCFILIVLILFLFPNTYNYATANPYNSAFDDDELEAQYPGAATSDCTFHLTWYGGQTLGSGLTASDCEYNDTMGWYEYEYNGENYVVLAAATRYLIGSGWSYASYIRYFRYGETISFKLNGTVYNGMILDSCGAAMNVSEGASQILDVYTCVSESSYSGAMTQYSGTEVEVSDDGTWSSSAGTSTSSTLGDFILKCFAKIFLLIGDFFQMLMDRTGTDATSYDSITYTMSEIQENDELNEDINVVEGNDLSNDDDDEEDENNGIIKEVTIDEKWGKVTTTSSSSSDSAFAGTKYDLSESDLKTLAVVCEREQGSVIGAAAEASLMANLYELKGSNYDSIVSYVLNSGWFASKSTSGASSASVSSEILEAVRDVLVNGNRTLPLYIDEHDYIGDITSATNNGTAIDPSDRNSYIAGTTIINNCYGSTYTFYCFPTDTSDPFGYTDEAYAARGGTSTSTSSTSTIKEIPVIPIEIYSSSIEKVQLFDIDFLSTTNTNSNGLWLSISDVVQFMARIFLYVTAIALITSIIWRSIILVLASIRGNPESAEKSKEIINSVFKVVLYMVGIYVIIFMMIYLYKYILSLVIGDNDTSYIIRLNVENVYTFNTNITGYVRYKAVADSGATCFGYSFLYMLIVFMNSIYFLIMLARMVILALLTVIAPFTALSAMGEDRVQIEFSLANMFNFKVWLKLYTYFIWWPILVVIILRVLIMIS